jgi:hypothetical protein
MSITTTGKYAASLCGERGTHMAKGFGNAKPDKQSYTGFIKEILRVVENSKNNKKKVYSLLEKNLHLLDEQFLTVFKRWAELELSQASSREAANITVHIGNFCVLLFEFPLGEKASNLETPPPNSYLTHYQTVFPCQYCIVWGLRSQSVY